MPSVYTLREFRAKTKEAFDKADADEDVIVERSGVRYTLIHEDYYKELLKPEAPIESAFDPVKKEILGKPIANILVTACKHGYSPMMCKFVKNGKPCK